MAFADQRAHAAEMPAVTHASAWALASGAGTIPGRGRRGRRSLHMGHLLCCCHSRRAARAGCGLHRAKSWTGPKRGPDNAMPKVWCGEETPAPRGSGGELTVRWAAFEVLAAVAISQRARAHAHACHMYPDADPLLSRVSSLNMEGYEFGRITLIMNRSY